MNKYCMKCHKTTKFEVSGLTAKCSECYTVMEIVSRPQGRTMIGSPWNCRYGYEEK